MTPVAAVSTQPPGVDQQRADAQRHLVATQNQLAADVATEASLDRQIADTQAEADRLRAHLKLLAKAIYVQPGSLVVEVAEQNNPADAIRYVADLQVLTLRAREEGNELTADQARIRELTDERDQARRHEAALRAELQLALIQTAGLNVWSTAHVWQQANPDYKAPANPNPNPLHTTSSPLANPLPGAVVTQPYGPTNAWFEPPFGGSPHFHTGLDVSAPYGTPVLAADDGVVIAVGADGYGYGNYVLLGQPGGLVTLYAHLERALVKTGEKVTQGQRIALEGSTGNSTGAHLHFEVLVDGLPVDPKPYLPS